MTHYQQLTPDEVLLLTMLNGDDNQFCMLEQYVEGIGLEPPLISETFHALCTKAKVARLDLAQAYLENLLRLRVFSETHTSSGHIPETLGNKPQTYPPRMQTTTVRMVQMTEFGEQFLHVCAGSQATPLESGV